MKYIKLISIFSVMIATSIMISCNKDIDSSEGLTALNPIDLDADAGNWTLIPGGPMTTITQVPLAAPLPVTDPTYVAELATIKAAQGSLTETQKNSIEYWSVGGILRWNQILRELVARYNLPPAPRENDTYVFPDVNNPFADPAFPFSNPPYAARAYSYVAAAQYEALLATWHYKYQYNRPAPYDVAGSGVNALVPKTALPAYPSEDAVISGVTAEILKALFPAAVEEITLKAGEQRLAAQLSGKAAASDILAGFNFGKSVAALFTTRAGGDGMGNAVGNAVQWYTFRTQAESRGEIPWSSLETPPRPPMLPGFGNVKGWFMTPADFVTERPAAPPSTSSAEMTEEVKEVKYYAEHVTRDRIAIVHKWADGVGTYTPPGHWNDIAEEYVAAARFSEVRAARAFALLNMTMHDAAIGCWNTKYFYFNPRPSQMDYTITTVTGVPNFPAYTSGHSTFSGSAATVLSYLFPSQAAYFDAQASEASISRLYGAIHYRSDINMGLAHGKKIGGYAVTFASSDGAD